MSSSAVTKFCFMRDISFSDLEDEYEPETGSAVTEKPKLDLAGPPYSTHCAKSDKLYSRCDLEARYKRCGERHGGCGEMSGQSYGFWGARA